MMFPELVPTIFLTLKLAGLTTILLMILVTPLAWGLTKSHSWGATFLTSALTLPLVLPPTVLGFYLLIALSPQNFLGKFSQAIGWGQISFSFSGLVIASIIYSLPFALQPLLSAFKALGKKSIETAMVLGARPLSAFFTVVIPQARFAFVNSAIMVFAHTIGEFGIVLMIGGNIPGETQVISTQLYEYVEMMKYKEAHYLAGGMVLFSFIVLLILNRFNQKDTHNV